jgi:hypothetical protein
MSLFISQPRVCLATRTNKRLKTPKIQVEVILMKNLSALKEHEMQRLGLRSMSAGVLSAESGEVIMGVC